MPDEGKRYENLGRIMVAPLDVILSNRSSETTILQPDIIFPDRERLSVISQRAIEGAPSRIGIVEGLGEEDVVDGFLGAHSPPAPSLANGDWTCQKGASSVVTTSSTVGSFALFTRSSSPTRSLSVSTRMPTQPIDCAILA